MNLVLQFVATLCFVCLPVYYLGVAAARRGQLVLGAGLVVGLFLWLVWRSYRSQTSTEEMDAEFQLPSHPLATIVLSAAKSSMVLAWIAITYLTAWGFGYWTPSESQPHKAAQVTSSAAASLLKSIGGQFGSSTPVSAFDVAIVDTRFDNEIQFLTVVVTNPLGEPVADILLDDFQVTAAGLPCPILTAATTMFERPVAGGILRDVSGSALASNPFTDIILTSTTAIIEAAREKLREPVIGVVDFAGNSVVTLPWTTKLDSAAHIPLGKPQNQAGTAVANTIVRSCQSLARRTERRQLCVITDGGNNVQSAFDTWGVIAEANRCDVSIDVVALPTQALTEERVKMLQLIATKTHGTYLDGAAANLKASIARAVDGWRRPLPAYRFAIRAGEPLPAESWQVRLAGMPNKVPEKVTFRRDDVALRTQGEIGPLKEPRSIAGPAPVAAPRFHD